MDVAIAKQNIDNDGITKLIQNVRLSSCLKVASMNSEMCRVWLLHFRFFFHFCVAGVRNMQLLEKCVKINL